MNRYRVVTDYTGLASFVEDPNGPWMRAEDVLSQLPQRAAQGQSPSAPASPSPRHPSDAELLDSDSGARLPNGEPSGLTWRSLIMECRGIGVSFAEPKATPDPAGAVPRELRHESGTLLPLNRSSQGGRSDA